jgi:3-hydroxyacyl-[acyl-carrier-protein] dehydratase
MRWMWIDRVVEVVPRERLVAIKNVSLAEEHLHDHFPADAEAGQPALPVMPASLVIEGMAQTGGVLVGHAVDFAEKVVLAKVSRVELTEDAPPGVTLRYTARVQRLDDSGASTRGDVELLDPTTGHTRTIGRIDLIFAFADRNRAGAVFPEHNFVFGEQFKTLLHMSGLPSN